MSVWMFEIKRMPECHGVCCAVVPITPTLSVTTPSSGDVVDGTTITLTCSSTSATTGATVKYRLTTDGTLGSAQTANMFTDTVDITSASTYKCEASYNGGTSWSSVSTDLTPTSKVV